MPRTMDSVLYLPQNKSIECDFDFIVHIMILHCCFIAIRMCLWSHCFILLKHPVSRITPHHSASHINFLHSREKPMFGCMATASEMRWFNLFFNHSHSQPFDGFTRSCNRLFVPSSEIHNTFQLSFQMVRIDFFWTYMCTHISDFAS